jgi:hypothetical protein
MATLRERWRNDSGVVWGSEALRRSAVAAVLRLVLAQLFPVQHIARRLGVSTSALRGDTAPSWEACMAVPTTCLRTRLQAIRWVVPRYLQKSWMLRRALTEAPRPRGQALGGPCDRQRFLALWQELHGVHIPFTNGSVGLDGVTDTGGVAVPRYLMDDVDVLDPEGLYAPVYSQDASRGEIGAALSHAKAWLLAFVRQRPLVVIEDDIILPADFLRQLNFWIHVSKPLAPNWDWFHFGVGDTHGGQLSPLVTEDDCPADDCYYNWSCVAAPSDCSSPVHGCGLAPTGGTKRIRLVPHSPWPACSSLWRPQHTQHGFLGYMLSSHAAEEMIVALPAGADVDNWYAIKVMNQQLTWLGNATRKMDSFTVWPNLVAKAIGDDPSVDASDTHVHL